MYCTKCGKLLRDGSKFCDACGTKTWDDESNNDTVEPSHEIQQEKKISFQCQLCGAIIPSDAIKCPYCGYEIRGREVSEYIQIFFDKVSCTEDENKKIEMIKMFPIPNSKEEIMEFMFLASSMFDADFYATNTTTDSLSGAWMTKIDLCYKKATVMFTDLRDLSVIKKIYTDIHERTREYRKAKIHKRIIGFTSLFLGLLLTLVFDSLTGEKENLAEENPVIGLLSIFALSLIALGIVFIVLGFKKKKTSKQIEEAREYKLKKKELKYKYSKKK